MDLVAAVAEAFDPGATIERGTGAAAIAEDLRRIDSLLDGGCAASKLRLWTNRQCLVTTRRFARMERFPSAMASSAARGWPVFVRTSGGTTVAHRPGILNVSRYQIWREGQAEIMKRFKHFADFLVDGLRGIGLPAEVGTAEGSYCDGRFNILADGRKIAGTACLARQRRGWVGLLAHASIWINGDINKDISAILAFEHSLGIDTHYRPDVHGCLSDFSS